jgi:hypothetical protein
VRLIWGVQGGRGSSEQEVPQRRKPTSRERRWWHRGAAEGASNGVEGAHSVGDGGFGEGPERQSTVTSIAAQLWQSGSGGRKGVAPRGGGCSFSSSQRWLAMVVRVAAGAGAALKLWGW